MNWAEMSVLERTRITQKDEDKRESRFTKPRATCPHPEHWHSQDIDATEDEVCEWLHGMIRCIQPDYVIETGAHRGLSTVQIGRALKKNGHGLCVSCEIEPELAAEATVRCEGLPVDIVVQSSLELEPAQPIDFAWLDSGPGMVRAAEFMRFFPHFHRASLVAFHDAIGGQIFESIVGLAKKKLIVPVFLPTPRGLALCRVVTDNPR